MAELKTSIDGAVATVAAVEVPIAEASAFGVLAVDEAHNFLNRSSERSRVLLGNMADHTILFTATPAHALKPAHEEWIVARKGQPKLDVAACMIERMGTDPSHPTNTIFSHSPLCSPPANGRGRCMCGGV